MPIYELGPESIRPIEATTFTALGLLERRDLQRLIREHISVISPDTMVIAEEYGDWDESRRRIDILCLDKEANLVVVELKRNDDGGHMELQAIRYAAMVSKMTFDQAASALAEYLTRLGRGSVDSKQTILDFLGWAEPEEGKFAQDVRIVLASAEFSKEITSAVIWLNDRDLDIRCVRLKPYRLDERVIVDVQQILPLPELQEYQVQVREKQRKEREAREGARDYTRYDVAVGNDERLGLNKRNAIFTVCKALCDRGSDPESLASVLGNRGVWFAVDGTWNAEGFMTRARLSGRSFDSSRWFCKDSELVGFGGKTYALSNQWGAESWLQAMNALKDAFPAYGISFTASA